MSAQPLCVLTAELVACQTHSYYAVSMATACAYQDPHLRSLDAIHLATASAVFGAHLSAFVTYDKRLLAAADALGLVTAHPGS